MPESSIPYRDREEIERKASDLLVQHGLTTVPIDPIRLARALKIRVLNARFSEESISGVLTRRGPNVSMLINAADAATRKRFTIAHELGHRILEHFDAEPNHTDRNSDLFRSSPSKAGSSADRAEIQANLFAAALLMPANLVAEFYADTHNVDELAHLFQVSAEAMGNRLDSLGLLT